MKTKHILAALLLGSSVLLASCTGGLMAEVVDASVKVDKNYQRILGFDTSANKVWYQTYDGIFSNVNASSDTEASSEVTLVGNSSGNLVRSSCLYFSSSTSTTPDYILYFSTESGSNDTERTTIGVYDIANSTDYPEVPFTVGSLDSSGGYRVKALNTDGAIVVRTASDDDIYHIGYVSSVSTTAVTFDDQFTLDVTPSGSSSYDIGTVFTYTDASSNVWTLITMVEQEDKDDEDSDYNNYLYLYENDTAVLSGIGIGRRPVNFAVNADGSYAYVLTRNGRVYFYNLSTQEYGYSKIGSYYGTGCLMYLIETDSTDYLVTKPYYKTSGSIVVSFDHATGGSNFDTDTVRRGFGRLISKDVVTAWRVLNETSDSEKYLLCATNESGMVTIRIEVGNITSNSSSNGASTEAEHYVISDSPSI